jgi:CRISPR-associated endonuclease Csn1
MRYRLGIDVGTASLAIVVFLLDEHGQPQKIVHHVVVIFDESIDKGENDGAGASNRSVRGKALRLQRQITRRAERLIEIAHLTAMLGISADKVSADDGQHLHAIRARAAAQPVGLDDLLRIFLKMSKRRGYSGGFRARKEAGEVQSGISELDNAMLAAQNDLKMSVRLTLGQYLNYRYQRGLTLKLKEAVPKLYVSREQVEAEFEQIWQVQSEHHPVLKKDDIKEAFRQTLFFQNPLRSPAAMVGNCGIYENLPRAPLAQPAAQKFRIEKQIADLRWGRGNHGDFLWPRQKEVIRGLLNDAEKVSFDDIYAALEASNCPAPPDGRLNVHRVSRKYLRGDSTREAMRKIGLLELWDQLPQGKGKDGNTQISIINFLADLGSPEQLEDEDWHQQFIKSDGRPRNFSNEFVEFIEALKATGKMDRLPKMGFESGRGSYSLKALNEITALMGELGCDEYSAVSVIRQKLPARKATTNTLLPPHKTGNVVVDKSMRQLQMQLEDIFQRFGGPPESAIVELMRDLPKGLTARREKELENAKNREARENAKNKIVEKSEGRVVPSERNIDRWLLWKEMGEVCPYCCEKPISFGDAMNGFTTNIEHILPRKITQVRARLDHLVLAHKACNDAKGSHQTPYQAFRADESRLQWIAERVKLLEQRGKKLERKSKFDGQGHHAAEARQLLAKAARLRAKDFDDEELTNELLGEFTDRQFTDTSWLAKLVQPWLESAGVKVTVTRGGYTAFFRRIWGLDTVIPEVRYKNGFWVLDTVGERMLEEDFEKYRPQLEGHARRAEEDLPGRRLDKRIDHRHHLIDALVIGLTPKDLYDRKARFDLYAQSQRIGGIKVKKTFCERPALTDLRKRAVELVEQCNLVHKTDHNPGGRFFLENPCSVVEKDGEVRLAMRKKLSALGGNKATIESVHKAIKDIASEQTQTVVLDTFNQRIEQGLSIEKALAPIPMRLAGGHRTEISRVKVWVDGEARAIRYRSPRQGRHVKYLRQKGYAYCEITVENGKLSGRQRLVRYAEALHEREKRPASNVKRFWKGDTVRHIDGKLYVVNMITADGGGRLCFVPIVETCGFNDLSKRGKKNKKTARGDTLAKLQLVNV